MGAVAVEGFETFVVVEVAVLVLVVDVVAVGASSRPTIVAELWLSAKPSALGLVADCSLWERRSTNGTCGACAEGKKM